MIDLMLGDCLEHMKEIESGSVDMVLTDPPYGTTACKWDSVIPLEPMWEQLKRIVKPNGAIVMTASQPFTTKLISSNYKMFKYEWIWEKPKATGHLNSKKRPMLSHENIVVFYGKQSNYNPQKVQGDPYAAVKRKSFSKGVYSKEGGHREGNLNGMRYPRSVNVFSTPHHPLHPTQKPVELMEYLIKTYTNEGETVLDFTMGSGTTGVAAKNLNRDFIGIEMDAGYFQIAKNRINEAVSNV